MKNALLKFAGLFVERIPVDERGKPLPPVPKGAAPRSAPAPGHVPGGHPGQPHSLPSAMVPAPYAGQVGQPLQVAPIDGVSGPGMPHLAVPPGGVQPIAVALRAWVPQEYATHLAPFGVHVIAAGGSVTSEQARGWGADVLVVSAECLGQDVHLLQQPQLPTVFITPQPVMIPDIPGVVQVQEPLRASDVAQAAREAAGAFGQGRY